MKVTEAMRYEVISTTGLCLNPRCKSHDAVVERIWKYKEEAYESGWEQARLAEPIRQPNFIGLEKD